MFDKTLLEQARALVSQCAQQGLRVVTAESCTGGLLAALITEIPGSSAMFERGFVVYANEAKTSNLGVAPTLLRQCGAVSAEVASAMATGALMHSSADASVAVTGIAGPSGGSAEKPVGMVFLATAKRGKPPVVQEHYFRGDRTEIRKQATAAALALLQTQIVRDEAA